MRSITARDEETGREITFDWDDDVNDPTDADMSEIFAEATTRDSALAEAPDTATPEKTMAGSSMDAAATALFPTADKAKSVPGQAVGGALDLLSIPTRALAAATTKQRFGDPAAYMLKKPTEAVQRAIDKRGPINMPVNTGFSNTGALVPSVNQARDRNVDIRPVAKGAVGLAGATLSDPAVVAGLLGATGGKAVKNVGRRIEEGVLGKGAGTVLKKQGVTLPQAAEGALKNKLGGNMATVLEKSDEIIGDLENNIHRVVSSYNGPKQVNIEYAIHRAKQYVNENPRQFFMKKDEVLSALDDLGRKFEGEGITGNISVQDAQDIKRWLATPSVPDAATGGMDEAAYGLKMVLARDIEDIVPGIKQYNNIYREIMPAVKIAQKRMTPEMARDPLGLGDLGAMGVGSAIGRTVSGGSVIPAALAMRAGYAASKSGKTAQSLYDLGNAMRGQRVAPIGAAATTVQNRRERQ